MMKMKFTSMKTWPFVFIALCVFVAGAEEFFISPTAWFYLESLGQTKFFLGIVMSAFSVSEVFAGPIIGQLGDKFGHIKCIAIICCLLHISGNVIYSIPISGNFPLVGRLVSGVGNGSSGIFFGQIVLYTPEKYCAKVFIFLDGVYTLGTTFAPFISSFLLFNVNILGWKINSGNSPGIVLAMIWLIVLLVGLFLPSDFGKNNTSGKKASKFCHQDEDPLAQLNSINERLRICSNSSIFCVFYQIFLSIVYSTIVTLYTPLLGLQLVHFQLIHVKLLFLNSSLFSLSLLLSLYIVADYFDERHLLGFLNIMQLVPIAILTYFASSWNNLSNSGMSSYILIAYICLGMPYFQFALGCSILPKITHPKDTAFYQSLSFSTLQLAILLGRLISGFVFSQTPLLFFCFTMALTWIIGALWFLLEYRNLGPAKNNS